MQAFVRKFKTCPLTHTHTPAVADIWNWPWHWQELTSTLPTEDTDHSIIARDSVKSALTLRTESRHLPTHCSTHPVQGEVIESVAIAYGVSAIAEPEFSKVHMPSDNLKDESS